MPNGTVKFFNAGKGFGFITSETGEKDIFVPSASLAASGIASLKPGQRVSFEETPDKKGPIAVKLVLLSEAPPPAVVKDRPAAPNIKPKSRLTYYHDHTSEWSSDVLSRIRDLGHEPAIVSYLESPPSKDQLRDLSRLLRENGQSLVRKYDPLFLDLRLDDRFIGDNEYWEAIIEHPVLIDGPLIATEIKAGLCHSEEAIGEFFGAAEEAKQPVAKPKGLSERALQILAGGAALVVPKAKPSETAPAESAEKPPGVKIPPRKKPRADAASMNRTKTKVTVKKRTSPKAPAKKKPKAGTAAQPKAKPRGIGKATNRSKSSGTRVVKGR